MKLPLDPIRASTLAEYYLASHARWAAMARYHVARRQLETARFYGGLARGDYASWQLAREAGV